MSNADVQRCPMSNGCPTGMSRCLRSTRWGLEGAGGARGCRWCRSGAEVQVGAWWTSRWRGGAGDLGRGCRRGRRVRWQGGAGVLACTCAEGGAVHKSTAAAARPALPRAGKRKPKKQGPAAGLCTLASLCTNSPVAAQEEPHRRLHGQPRSRHGHQPAGQRVASGGPCDLTTNAYI